MKQHRKRFMNGFNIKVVMHYLTLQRKHKIVLVAIFTFLSYGTNIFLTFSHTTY